MAKGLNEAGVEMIEVSHGDGFGGSTITYAFSRQSDSSGIRGYQERQARKYYYCSTFRPEPQTLLGEYDDKACCPFQYQARHF
jgi:hypothetical protein